MKPVNPLLMTDCYKIGHPFQYPEGTNLVYSNLTPRKTRMEGVDEMVLFGVQYFIKEYLIDQFNTNFFLRDKCEVVDEYKRIVFNMLGSHLPTYQHIEDLHDLGYLPIRIKAIPEGRAVPMRVPVLSIVSTRGNFYWLTNFIESLMSAVIWGPCTTATIAREYKRILVRDGELTGMPPEFINWQAHDFSFRGMNSFESASVSGMAHLLFFTGTDTVPAIPFLENYYNADSDKELIGGSVAATEHAVMCAGGDEGEIDTFRRLINETYPRGIISIVSDTWNLWTVLTDYMLELKSEILARDGKVVIRPDSGIPEDILCGDPNGATEEERKGVIQLLWEVFGGTYTEKGYKLLDSHIGAIYGDSITLARAEEINRRLMERGFACQVVFGVGSFTYQYNTRDTFGTAMKATYVEIDGVGRNIFKDPVTDDGTKKSATGLLRVDEDENGRYHLTDGVTWEEEQGGALRTVFEDGRLVIDMSLAEIRANAAQTLM